MLIKGKSFDFHYQDVISAIEEILERQDVLEKCHWDYEDNYIDGNVIYFIQL